MSAKRSSSRTTHTNHVQTNACITGVQRHVGTLCPNHLIEYATVQIVWPYYCMWVVLCNHAYSSNCTVETSDCLGVLTGWLLLERLHKQLCHSQMLNALVVGIWHHALSAVLSPQRASTMFVLAPVCNYVCPGFLFQSNLIHSNGVRIKLGIVPIFVLSGFQYGKLPRRQEQK